MNTLMATPEGVKYLLVEDQFLSQIGRSFAQLDPVRPSIPRCTMAC